MIEPQKKYYSIREMRTLTGLPSSTLRFWEQQFSQLSPRKDGHGNRYYTAADLEFVKRIKFIRDELKITRIDAIRNELNADKRNIDVRQQAVEILSNIREQLIEIRQLI